MHLVLKEHATFKSFFDACLYVLNANCIYFELVKIILCNYF